MPQRNSGATIAVGLLGAIALFALFSLRSYPATDFGIFYCAGRAIDAHADPYRVEPLRTCERSVWEPGYLEGYAEPAASPGYALPVFALLSRLPFTTAKLLWLLLLSTAFGSTVVFLTRLSGLHPFAVLALCIVPVGLLNIRPGQIGGILLACIAASALLLRADRQRLAALPALLAMIEPHVGLPVVASLAFFAPRSRWLLGVGIAGLAALHFAVLGVTTGIEYARVLLPAMAHAELLAADQYGMSWLLHQGGLPSRLALPIATALYVVAMVLGLIVAGRAWERTGDAAMCVAIPVCAALLATPFLHDIEFCVALVAPLAALGATRAATRWLWIAAIVAVPWYACMEDRVLGVASIVTIAFFAFFTVRRPVQYAVTVSLVAAAACAIVMNSLRLLPLHPATTLEHIAVGSSAISAVSWAAFLRAHAFLIASGPQVLVPKMIAWGSVFVGVLLLMREKRRDSEHAEEGRFGLIRTQNGTLALAADGKHDSR
ncbi:MAG: glycosyltransferase family 87 protein [Vulcanimicrobiaceae bacterium]